MPAVLAWAGINAFQAVMYGIMVVSAVASYTTAYKARKAAERAKNDAQSQKHMFRSANAPLKQIYGVADVSGPIVFAQESPNDGDGHGEILHLVVPLAGHVCNRLQSCFLDEMKLTENSSEALLVGCDQFFESSYIVSVVEEGYQPTQEDPAPPMVDEKRYRAKAFIYDGTQTAVAPSLAGVEAWQSDMVGKGICFAHLVLYFDANTFPMGVPNFHAIVEGKKVFDPRSYGPVVPRFSSNPVLCARDYIVNTLNVASDKLPLENWIAAANECDEQFYDVYETRYSLACAFDIDTDPKDVLSRFSTCFAGSINRAGGFFTVETGAYYGPATITITEDDLLGSATLVPSSDRSSRLNTVTGQFVDPNQEYNMADFPAVVDSDAVEADGKELIADLDMTWVPSATQCQRIAHIELNKSRAGKHLELTAKYNCLPAVAGAVVSVVLPSLRLNGEEFKVISWSFTKGGIKLKLREELPEIYSNPSGLRTVTAPVIPALPSPWGTAPVTNLTFTDAVDGDEYQGLLNWDHANSSTRFNVAIYSSDKLLQSIEKIRVSELPLNGLNKDTIYLVKVTPVNSFGHQGDETAITFTPNLPAQPLVWVKLDAELGLSIKVQRISPGVGWAADTGEPISVKGDTGDTLYTWIKYADDAAGLNLSNSPTGKIYIGVAYNKTTATESTNAADYSWSLITGDKGDKGDDGLSVKGDKGDPGNDGLSIKGDDGSPGLDAPTLYTWFVYSNSNDGSSTIYTTNSNDCTFLGIRYNNLSSTANTSNAALYQWSKLKPTVDDVFSGDDKTSINNMLDGNKADGSAWGALAEKDNISANELEANAISSKHLTAIKGLFTNLSALNANMGTITGGLFRTAPEGSARAEMSSESISPYWFAAYPAGAGALPTWAVDKSGDLIVKPGSLTEDMLSSDFTSKLLFAGDVGQVTTTKESLSANSINNGTTITLPAITKKNSKAILSVYASGYVNYANSNDPKQITATLKRDGTTIKTWTFTTSAQTVLGKYDIQWRLSTSFEDTSASGSEAVPANHVYSLVISHGTGSIVPSAGSISHFTAVQEYQNPDSLSLNWSAILNKPDFGALYLGKTAKAADSEKLNGVAESQTSVASTIVKRDSAGDIQVRLCRSSYQDESRMLGGVAFRINTSDNYTRFCSDTSAFRAWLSAYSKSESDGRFGRLSSSQTWTGINTFIGNLQVNNTSMQVGDIGGGTGSGAITGLLNRFIEIVAPATTSHNQATGIVFHHRGTSTSSFSYVNNSSTTGTFSMRSDDKIINLNLVGAGSTSTGWRGQIGVYNGSDSVPFIGNHAGKCVVAGHNSTLSAWEDLYINCVVSGGGVGTTYASNLHDNGNRVYSDSNKGNIGTDLTNYAAGNHTHDSRYYTESESDNRYAYKAGSTAQDFNAKKSIVDKLIFRAGTPANDDAAIEWLGSSNAGYLRFSTADDDGTEYMQFGDYDTTNQGGAFTQWLKLYRGQAQFTGVVSAASFTENGATLSSKYSLTSHTHDGRYYTESESDGRFGRLSSSQTWTGINTFIGNLQVNNTSMQVGDIGGTGSGAITGLLNRFIEIVAPATTSHNQATGIVFHHRGTSTSSFSYVNNSSTTGTFSMRSDDQTISLNVKGNIEIGDYGSTATGALLLNGSTANKQAKIHATNGNLHIDAAMGGFITYLNYYAGSAGVVFGNGSGQAVARMDGAGSLSCVGVTASAQMQCKPFASAGTSRVLTAADFSNIDNLPTDIDWTNLSGGLKADVVAAGLLSTNFAYIKNANISEKLTANSIAANAITTDHLQADCITSEQIEVGVKLQSPTVVLASASSAFMKVLASEPFGPDSLMEWFGAKLLTNGEPQYSALTKNNAIAYTATDGSAYWAGATGSGIITESGSDSRNPSDPIAGPHESTYVLEPLSNISSNGRRKIIAVTHTVSGSVGSRSAISVSFIAHIQRRINGGSWVTLETERIHESRAITSNSYFDYEESFEVFDNDSTSSTDVDYQVYIEDLERIPNALDINTHKVSLVVQEK